MNWKSIIEAEVLGPFAPKSAWIRDKANANKQVKPPSLAKERSEFDLNRLKSLIGRALVSKFTGKKSKLADGISTNLKRQTENKRNRNSNADASPNSSSKHAKARKKNLINCGNGINHTRVIKKAKYIGSAKKEQFGNMSHSHTVVGFDRRCGGISAL